MKKLGGLFGFGNSLFWGLIIFLLLLALIQLFSSQFNGELVKESFLRQDSLDRGLIVLVDLDTIPVDSIKEKKNKIKEEPIADGDLFIWNWTDPYRKDKTSISFRIKKEDREKSTAYRTGLEFVSPEQVYNAMYLNDKNALNDLVNAYREICKARKFNYLESMEYIVGSIQTIPYTFVTFQNVHRCPCQMPFGNFLDDCRARPDGRGCCNDIEPFAVFSPIEFASQKTGDCDTRTLFAYTIFSELNFDVTILNSVAAGHSILGVHSPKPLGDAVYVLGKNGRKYYVWELTTVMTPGIYPYNVALSTWESVLK